MYICVHDDTGNNLLISFLKGLKKSNYNISIQIDYIACYTDSMYEEIRKFDLFSENEALKIENRLLTDYNDLNLTIHLERFDYSDFTNGLFF